MFKYIVLCGLLAVAYSAPGHEEVPIVSQQMDIQPDGAFRWSFESGDGTKQSQDATIKQVDKDTVIQAMQGSFEYKGDDGQVYALTYTADENGFVPQGAHLPVPPPIPEQIARALAFLATAPPPKVG